MTHARSEYKDFMSLTPDAYGAVLALGQVAAKAGMDKQLLELVKLRASQINGCAFCVQFHIVEGEKLGVPADKLNLVVVWREAPQFSARERAALAWTEALTLLGERLLVVSLVTFAAAWVGQFIGHAIEGRKPAFVDDLRSFLVAPAWLLGDLYRRLGFRL